MADTLKLSAILATFWLCIVATTAHANGLCPYYEQGPLGCPEGTVWYAEYEVCLPPQALLG
jgi:hypothetical protein